MSNLVPIKMLSAVAVLDSSREGWALLDVPATSPRTHDVKVTFEHPFASNPLVHVGIVGVDAGHEDNLRLRVRAIEVTSEGFSIQAETWFNTQIWSVEVSWLAIGV